jgi:uncharacterized phage protein gp47/JayE
MDPATIVLIEAGITALEQLAPALVNLIAQGGLDPDTAASYTQRIQTAMANLPKPSGT